MPQHIGRRITLLAVFLMVAVNLTIGGPTHAVAAPKGSPWGASYFPNVPLVTQDGRTVWFYDDLVKDKIVVINSIYTQCELCQQETAKMAQVEQFLGDRMGKDIFIYTITVDPQRDTPEVLKAYAEKFHGGPGWLFLTGKPADIDLLRKKLGFYAARDTRDPLDHTANLVIGNEASGQWMRHAPAEGPRYLAAMIEQLTARPRGAEGGAE
ncbi:MAG TPA: SCO family protein [Candidatus Methylomirabilis sp.]|nr:SCO family protein [Candidatus Methylomirabilis sp.]HSC70380.1 SCO family protein [Candidatus Methylomirabilis sp.]